MSRPIAYLDNDTLLTMTKHNRKIYVDGRDLSLAPHILMQGDWESWITTFVQRRILRRDDQPGAYFLDVGANFGWYSLVAGFTRENVYEVRAFEPNPRLTELLRRTFAVNGLPREWVIEKGASSQEGRMPFAWSPDDFGGGHLAGESLFSVELVPLDLVVPVGARVAIIKIDVEGHEPEVLKGAKRIIDENLDVELLVEHHTSEAEDATIAGLMEKGFSLERIGIDCNAHAVSYDELHEVAPAEMLYLKRE